MSIGLATLTRIIAMAAIAVTAAGADPVALTSQRIVGSGPCHDAAVAGSLLVAVGDGVLTTADLGDPLAPRPLGRLAGLGAVRQVVVAGGIAYVAAREDGLVVVDVRTPSSPRLISRYDTLEKATGIAVAGNLCFVACRYYGVEVIDISDPARPQHLSTAFPTLEAQSVAWDDGILYAGIWGDRQVAIGDVRDPRHPRELARAELDGFGDGVEVHAGILYAATGHHARAFTGGHWEKSRAGEPGWGAGHGLELWDVRDPSQPRLLARHKTRAFYTGVPDMWSVEVHGGTAFLTDTLNGVEVIDVSAPASPRPLARFLLPAPEAAGGLAVGDGALYVAGLGNGLYVVPAPGMAKPVPRTEIMPAIIADDPRPRASADAGWWTVRPGGQVREAVALPGDRIAVAAGDAGVHLLTLEPQPTVISTLTTRGPARSVAVHGNILAVAEGWGGMSTWRITPTGCEALGRWDAGGEAVLQVVLPAPGRWAVVEKGIRMLAVLDLQDPASPKEVASWTGPGIFYGPQIAASAIADRWLAWWWHTGGPYWLDLAAPGHPAPARPIAGNLQSGVSGAAVTGDTLLVMARHSGLVVMRPEDPTDLLELPFSRLAENRFGHQNMNGLATAIDDLLVVSNAAWSMIRVVDVADRAKPRLLDVIRTAGNPGRATVAHGRIVIPDGYEGVRIAPLAKLRPQQ
jgi:hypothetical protein